MFFNMNFSDKKFFRLAALMGALTVAIGAFGAHGLKPHLTAYQIEIFEKGVHYQFVHVLALLAVAIQLQRSPDNSWLHRAVWFFLAGIVAFSGSLYLLACRDMIAFPIAWVGPITPLGGLSFIAGWVSLFLSQKA